MDKTEYCGFEIDIVGISPLISNRYISKQILEKYICQAGMLDELICLSGSNPYERFEIENYRARRCENNLK